MSSPKSMDKDRDKCPVWVDEPKGLLYLSDKPESYTNIQQEEKIHVLERLIVVHFAL